MPTGSQVKRTFCYCYYRMITFDGDVTSLFNLLPKKPKYLYNVKNFDYFGYDVKGNFW